LNDVDSTTQVLTTLILLIALVVTVIMAQFIRRRRDIYPVRAVPAWDSVPLMIGSAVEAGRRVQLSSGAAGIGGAGTALALASAEALVQIGRRTAASGTPPLMTVGESTAIPLMMGALRRAWRESDRAIMPPITAVRWSPAVSLALAAALVAEVGDERVSGAVYIGDFSAAIALPLEAVARRRGMSIAGSTGLEGMAVAWALADAPLIGEEMFTAGAYLGDRASARAELVAQDVLRWLVIGALIAATLFALAEPLARRLGA
jgi:hypothetical protein